jgi:hypothetical protein
LPTWERFSLRGPFNAVASKRLETKRGSNPQLHGAGVDGTTPDYTRPQGFEGATGVVSKAKAPENPAFFASFCSMNRMGKRKF